uniref:Uncharacterized protein n=1 Tax=Sphaerodactylus townsendi TaxID=933632 RepID=A0ACB8FPU2_9SAUR
MEWIHERCGKGPAGGEGFIIAFCPQTGPCLSVQTGEAMKRKKTLPKLTKRSLVPASQLGLETSVPNSALDSEASAADLTDEEATIRWLQGNGAYLA